MAGEALITGLSTMSPAEFRDFSEETGLTENAFLNFTFSRTSTLLPDPIK